MCANFAVMASVKERSRAMTVALSEEMDAAQLAQLKQGFPALGGGLPVKIRAKLDAVMGSGKEVRLVMMVTRYRMMGVVLLVPSSLDTLVKTAAQSLRMFAKSAGTGEGKELKCVTMATVQMVMDALLRVKLKLPMPAPAVQLPLVIFARKVAVTVSEDQPRLPKNAMTVTPLLLMGALRSALLSLDGSAVVILSFLCSNFLFCCTNLGCFIPPKTSDLSLPTPLPHYLPF
jgi:hypothetical protein